MTNSQMSWLKDIKLISWDLDGTLYPASDEMSEQIEREKLKRVTTHLGTDLTSAQKKLDDLYIELGSNTKSLDELGIDGHQFFVEVWNSLPLKKYILPNPELVESFRQLHKRTNIKQLILTNSNSQETVAKKLKFIGFETKDFDQILTSIDIGFNKPDPRAFSPLLEFDKNIEAQNILSVGDRVKTDLTPAASLGMKTALITNDQSTNGGSTPDLVFSSPLDLIKEILN